MIPPPVYLLKADSKNRDEQFAMGIVSFVNLDEIDPLGQKQVVG